MKECPTMDSFMPPLYPQDLDLKLEFAEVYHSQSHRRRGRRWPSAASSRRHSHRRRRKPRRPCRVKKSFHVARSGRVDELEMGDLDLAVREPPLYMVATEFIPPIFRLPARARAISRGGSAGTRRSRVLPERGWLTRNGRTGRSSKAWPEGDWEAVPVRTRAGPGNQTGRKLLDRCEPRPG
jgi:hypothetical protein